MHLNTQRQADHYASYDDENDIQPSKNAGYIVQTNHGQGRTFHQEKPHNGKIKVFLNDGRKLLCSPEKIITIGFVD